MFISAASWGKLLTQAPGPKAKPLGTTSSSKKILVLQILLNKEPESKK